MQKSGTTLVFLAAASFVLFNAVSGQPIRIDHDVDVSSYNVLPREQDGKAQVPKVDSDDFGGSSGHNNKIVAIMLGWGHGGRRLAFHGGFFNGTGEGEGGMGAARADMDRQLGSDSEAAFALTHRHGEIFQMVIGGMTVAMTTLWMAALGFFCCFLRRRSANRVLHASAKKPPPPFSAMGNGDSHRTFVKPIRY